MKTTRIVLITVAMLAIAVIVTLWQEPAPATPPGPTQTVAAAHTATAPPMPSARAEATTTDAPDEAQAAPLPGWAVAFAFFCALLAISLSSTRGAQARWAGAIIAIWLSAVLWLFGLPGLILATLSGLIMFTLTVGAARGSYKGLRAAMLDQWRILRGVADVTETVEDGRSTMKEKSSTAPRTVVIKPYNAVIFEEGSKQTRICGPAKLTGVKHTEKIKRIYDLRPRQEEWTFPNVLTQDMISTTIVMAVTYRINISPLAARGGASEDANKGRGSQQEQGPDQPAPAGSFDDTEKSVIQKVDSLMPDWQRGVHSVVAESVHTIVAGLDLNQLRAAQNNRNLERQVLQRARRAAQTFGTMIDRIIIENVQPEKEVVQAATGTWVADRQGEAVQKIDTARAEAWAKALDTLATAYKEALSPNEMPTDALQWEAWRRTLEQIARDIRISTH